MNTDLSQVIQQVCNDDVYINSYKDYLTSQNSKFLSNIDSIKSILSGDSVDSSELLQCVALNDGTIIKLSSLKEAVDNDLDVCLAMDGTSVNIDLLIDQVNDQENTMSAVIDGFQTMLNSEKDQALAAGSLFATKLYGKYQGCSASLKAIGERIADLVSDKCLPVRDKVTSLYRLINPDDSNVDAADYDAVLDLEDHSDLNAFTGVMPMKSIQASVKQFISDVDLSSVKNAITSGWNACKNAFHKGVDYIKDHAGEAVANIARTTLEWAGVTNTDWSTIPGGDGTIDNTFVVFDDTATHWKNNFSDKTAVNPTHIYDRTFTYNIDGVATTFTLKDLCIKFINEMNRNTWYTFDIPGARIYVGRYGSGDRNDTTDHVRFVYKWKPIDLSCLNAIADMDSNVISDLLIGAANRSAAFDPTLDENFYTLDEYMFDCTLLGKALATNFCAFATDNQLGSDYSVPYGSSSKAAFALAIAAFAATGTGINPTVSGHQVVISGVTYDDPTNEDFAKVCSSFGDGHPDIYPAISVSPYYQKASDAMLFANYIITPILIWANQLDGGTNFTPYYQSRSISQGSYHIRSDKDNVNKVLMRAAGVAATAIVIGVAAVSLGSIKRIRQKAVESNLQAGILQTQMQEKMKNGIAITAQERANVYKATKKAVRLNRLSGGFGSITTGLSTWSNESNILPSLNSDNAAIKTLITGPIS